MRINMRKKQRQWDQIRKEWLKLKIKSKKN